MPPETDVREFSSGAPWNLTFRVETDDGDLLCRLFRKDRRVAAVAVSQWAGERARTTDLESRDTVERNMARFAAHALCNATHRRVRCVIGVCSAALGQAQVAALSQTAYAVTRRAARELADERVRGQLDDRRSVYARLQHGMERVVEEITEFLSSPLVELMARHSAEVRASYREHFGNDVRLFAPLYLSNACCNDCAYCGFRRSAVFGRTRLRVEAAVEQADRLAGQGHRTIDLVTGEVTTDAFVAYVGETTRRILEETPIRRIHLNLGTLSPSQFGLLHAAGATGYHLYQETYDAGRYAEVHRSGPKRDMALRLDGAHRAATAGFDYVGLGILLGLHPLERDLAGVVRHAQLLRQDFPGVRIGFSLPRIRRTDEACSFQPAAPVDDESFAKALLFLRLRFPAASLALTTREAPALRDELISLGISRLSAGVSTAPGGYGGGPAHATAQFAIIDRRPLEQVAEAVRRSGCSPVYG